MNKIWFVFVVFHPSVNSLLISEKVTRFIYPGVKYRVVQKLVSNTFFCVWRQGVHFTHYDQRQWLNFIFKKVHMYSPFFFNHSFSNIVELSKGHNNNIETTIKTKRLSTVNCLMSIFCVRFSSLNWKYDIIELLLNETTFISISNCIWIDQYIIHRNIQKIVNMLSYMKMSWINYNK